MSKKKKKLPVIYPQQAQVLLSMLDKMVEDNAEYLKAQHGKLFTLQLAEQTHLNDGGDLADYLHPSTRMASFMDDVIDKSMVMNKKVVRDNLQKILGIKYEPPKEEG